MHLLISVLFAFGGLSNSSFIDHGELYVAPHTVAVASGMNGPAECAVYRFAIEIGTLSSDVMEDC